MSRMVFRLTPVVMRALILNLIREMVKRLEKKRKAKMKVLLGEVETLRKEK